MICGEEFCARCYKLSHSDVLIPYTKDGLTVYVCPELCKLPVCSKCDGKKVVQEEWGTPLRTCDKCREEEE